MTLVEHYLPLKRTERRERCACGGELIARWDASERVISEVVKAHQETRAHKSWQSLGGMWQGVESGDVAA